MAKLSPPPPDDDDGEAFWLITYSDMVTLLLAFFLVIYSFTVMGKEQQKKLVGYLNVVTEGTKDDDPDTPEDLEKTAEEIAELMSQNVDEKAWVKSTETEVTVGLPSGVTFASGDATLTPVARGMLVEVAAKLSRLPNPIRVEGHTDNIPMRGVRFPNNWHLSVARAQAVLRIFLDQGVPPTQMQVVGYGETRPLENNDTPDGRRANRRIEIKIIRQETQQEQPDLPLE